MLVKISAALDPKVLDFSNYDVMFHIPRVLPKPGMSLASDADYGFMTHRARNMTTQDPTINISIIEKASDETEKENQAESVGTGSVEKGKGKKVTAGK